MRAGTAWITVNGEHPDGRQVAHACRSAREALAKLRELRREGWPVILVAAGGAAIDEAHLMRALDSSG